MGRGGILNHPRAAISRDRFWTNPVGTTSTLPIREPLGVRSKIDSDRALRHVANILLAKATVITILAAGFSSNCFISSKMSKKKRLKHKLKSRTEIEFGNILRGTTDPDAVLSQIRESLSISEYKHLLNWILSNPFLQSKVFPNEQPRRWKDLSLGKPLAPISTNRELRWAAAYLHNHSDLLSEFVSSCRQYSAALLKDDYECCEEVLGEMEDHIGYSLWLIKNRLALLELSNGLEAQKQYLNEVREKTHANGIAAYVGHFVSVRNESAVTAERFSHVFDTHIASLDAPLDIEVYVRYHIVPTFRLSESDIAAILRYEFGTTVVDYYEAFIRMSQMVVCLGTGSLREDILASLQMVSPINDSRIDTMLFELNGIVPTKESHTTLAMEVFDRFLTGQEIDVETTLSHVRESPDDFDALELLARPRVFATVGEGFETKGLLTSILSDMASIAGLDSTADEAIARLQKFWLNFNSLSWSNSVLSFLRKEGRPEPVDLSKKIRHFCAINTASLHPLRIDSFPDVDVRRRYADLLQTVYGNTEATLYARALADGSIPTEGFETFQGAEGNLLRAEAFAAAEKFSEALIAAQDLARSNDPYYRKRAIRIACICLLELGRLPECLLAMTQAFVRQPNLHHVLPIVRAVNLIDANDRIQLSDDLSLSIAFDMYSKYVGSQLDEYRSFAYEDFLTSKGIARPSQLNDLIPSLDPASAIYYLKNLCVESVMDTSTVFESSLDVTEERLAVLKILVDIDPVEVEAYHTEIKEIQSRLMIKQRLREVEQSKIYVDIEGVKQKIDSSMRESFSRYTSYLRHGIDADRAVFQEAARRKAAEGDIEGLLGLKLPQNEMNELFRAMVVELRDEYVSSAEHGLNWFLSVRIRHGTFSGHLRSPLEAGSLVTQRDRVTGEYKPNSYWLDRLQIEDESIEEYLADKLALFSKAFDDFIQQILSDWLQIRREANERGLFNFIFAESQVDLLSSRVTDKTTYERFIEMVFSVLTERLSGNLDTIRQRLEQEAEQRIDEFLNSLLLDVSGLGEAEDVRDLTNSITAARTEMHVAFDRVIEWFRLARTPAFEPFYIEDAIHISIESVRTFAVAFTAEVSIKIKNLQMPFHGRQLSTVVDIFFIVFENIVRHSEADSPHADVIVTYGADSIQFRIENPIGPHVATAAALAKIAKLQSAIHERTHAASAVSKEGGTGLFKLWRMVAHDFVEEPTIDFGFIGNERFYVEFAVSITREEST